MIQDNFKILRGILFCKVLKKWWRHHEFCECKDIVHQGIINLADKLLKLIQGEFFYDKL